MARLCASWPIFLGVLATGCGGAAPLLHTAHPLPEEEVTVGAGFSGSINVTPPELQPTDVREAIVEEAATAPGFAPWVGGRLGLGGDNDAGLTYTARTVRLDGRHSFVFGDEREWAVSLGLGASGILPKEQEDTAARVGGFGGDVPLLIGFNSDADIYGAYLGIRGGAEYLRGQRALAPLPTDPFPESEVVQPITGWHTQAGALLGVRIGFRYLYAALEVAGDVHWAQVELAEDLALGAVGGRASFRTFAIRPAGALIGRF